MENGIGNVNLKRDLVSEVKFCVAENTSARWVRELCRRKEIGEKVVGEWRAIFE